MTDDVKNKWPVIATDLRDTLARSGVSTAVADRVFAAVAPAVTALQRERGGVEHDLLFVLIATAGDIYLRHASR